MHGSRQNTRQRVYDRDERSCVCIEMELDPTTCIATCDEVWVHSVHTRFGCEMRGVFRDITEQKNSRKHSSITMGNTLCPDLRRYMLE